MTTKKAYDEPPFCFSERDLLVLAGVTKVLAQLSQMFRR
jgi:hypothetical protein